MRTSRVAVTGTPVLTTFSPAQLVHFEQQASSVSLCSVAPYQDSTTSLDSLPDDILLPLWLLVDPERFELSTFSMPLRRAPNCAMGPNFLLLHFSGPGGIRTLDLFSAIEARSQLRYRPMLKRPLLYSPCPNSSRPGLSTRILNGARISLGDRNTAHEYPSNKRVFALGSCIRVTFADGSRANPGCWLP